MAFLFYIDNQLTDQPVNDRALVTTIKRNSTLSALLITQEVELVYNANNAPATGTISGFSYLKSLFDSGSCQEAAIVIVDQVSQTETRQLYTGVLKVPQISVDMQRLNLSVNVQDNSFYSYINNNKSIEYSIQSAVTKNRQSITPPDIYEVDCFDSFTGIYNSTIGNYCRGYRVYDVFEFLIAAISDNKIGFSSNFLLEAPELFIFDGFTLANPNTDPTVITSFGKLYSEVAIGRNVSFYIDTSDQANPVLRLENFGALYSGTQLTSFDDIKHMIVRIKTDKIYSTVKVGASSNPGGSAPTIYTFNAGTSYFGWMEEDYTPLGQCNIDNTLNLMSDFGITSNDVNNQVNGAMGDTNADKIYLIECEDIDTVGLTATAIAYPSWVDTPRVYYNQGLNNPSKLLAHGSSYQTGLTNTLETGQNGFQASLGQDLLLGIQSPASSPSFAFGYPGYTIQPVVFSNETSGANYDGGNNYNNANGHYTTPLLGAYSFQSRLDLDIINLKSCSVATSGGFITIYPTAASTNAGFGVATLTFPVNVYWAIRIALRIRAYTDATLTTLIQSTFTEQNFAVNGTATLTNTLNAVLPVGAVVIASVTTSIGRYAPGGLITTGGTVFPPLPNSYLEYLNANGWNISSSCGVPAGAPPTAVAFASSIYKCTGSPDGVNISIENDPYLYKDKEYEFNYEINEEDFLNITLNPTGYFNFEKDGITRQGWIDTIQRDDFTGQCKIKLINSDT